MVGSPHLSRVGDHYVAWDTAQIQLGGVLAGFYASLRNRGQSLKIVIDLVDHAMKTHAQEIRISNTYRYRLIGLGLGYSIVHHPYRLKHPATRVGQSAVPGCLRPALPFVATLELIEGTSWVEYARVAA